MNVAKGSLELALLRQSFAGMLTLCPPGRFSEWKPTEVQRSAYVRLLETVLFQADSLRDCYKRDVLEGGAITREVAPEALVFLRSEVEPLIPLMESIYRELDAGGAQFYEIVKGILTPSGADQRIKRTFEVGIQQVQQIIDDNPGQDFWFLPGQCWDVIESPLIGFEPDKWLDRIGALNPVRVAKADWLNQHLRRRMIELFRVYTYGCPFSVVALARSILEYALHENIKGFGISPVWELGGGRTSEKSLVQLAEDVGGRLPEIAPLMDLIRVAGNDYLHPRSHRESKAHLFNVESRAREVVEALISVLEVLYLSRSQPQ